MLGNLYNQVRCTLGLENIKVKGRVERPGEFVHSVSPGTEGVLLRFDHNTDLQFWLEVYIPVEELEEMIRQIKTSSHWG